MPLSFFITFIYKAYNLQTLWKISYFDSNKRNNSKLKIQWKYIFL